MHDDKSWLKCPVLPRPPALPEFGPEMRALIGLDPSELEKDAISGPPSAAQLETSELDSSGDTYLEELMSVSEVVRGKRRAIRTGT